MKVSAIQEEIKLEDVERHEVWIEKTGGLESEVQASASPRTGAQSQAAADFQASAADGGGGGGNRKSTVKLVLKRDVELIHRRKVLMSLLLTDERLFLPIFKLYRTQLMGYFTSIFWLPCNIHFLSFCFGKSMLPLGIYIPLQTICAINLIIQFTVLIRLHLIKRLLQSFNFWFSIYNIISFTTCFILLWGQRIETYCCVVHIVSSLMLMLMFDSHAGKDHLLMKSSSFIAVVSIIPVAFVLLFQLVDFNIENFNDDTKGVEIVNVRLQALDNLSTLIVYLLRIFYTQVIRKRKYVISFISRFYEIEMPMHQNRTSGIGIRDEKSRYPKDALGSDVQLNSIAPSPEGNVGSKQLNSTSSAESNCLSPGKSINVENAGHEEAQPDHTVVQNRLDAEKFLVIGIMETKFIEYDLNLTAYHKFVSKKNFLLARVIKSSVYHSLGIFTSLVSIIFTYLLCAGLWIDSMEICQKIGQIVTCFGLGFITFQMVLTSNIIIFTRMLHSFDFWYFVSLLLKMLISSGQLCNWDFRMTFWIYSVALLYWFIMIDSFHVKSRKLSYFSLLGVFWTFSLASMCKLGIGNTFSHDNFIHFRGIRILSSKITLSTSLLSTCIFLARFLWSYHKNPNRMLFITENIEVRDINVVES